MSEYRMQHRRLLLDWLGPVAFAAGAAVAVPAPLAAQGAVSGRIAITERPGEQTTDFGSTVIYLTPKDTASARTRPTRGTIAMNGRAFVPHVRVVTPGSRVDFPNQDPFSHNIFSSSPGAVFDLGLYPAGKSKDAPFRRPGAYAVYCNIHPRMTAFVVVAPSPWFAQAGNDGRWTIAGVPAGEYTLTVWHERTPAVNVPVTVTAGGLADFATSLDARGFRFVEHKNKFGREYDKNSAVRY